MRSTLAAKMVVFDGSSDPETLARIQFFQTDRPDVDNFSFNFVKAARCKDVYADEIAADKDSIFALEFSNPEWICPDVQSFEIYNNPFLFKTGRNFVMVVNDCNVAVQADSDAGLTSYSDKTC